MAIVVVCTHQEWNENEELHLTGDEPGPVHAVVVALPWDDIVEEGQMPNPVLITCVCILILEEERTITTKEHNESPVEKHCEGVEWPESHNTIHDDETLTAWKLAIVELYAHQ